jgi:ATP-dependent exoDNAse (exonuclease V) beta subunit
MPAISEEALMVSSSSKVKLLISALKHLRNSEDTPAIAEFNFFHNEIFKGDQQYLTEPGEILTDLNQFKGYSLFDLVEELMLQLKLTESCDLYLQQFLDICLTRSKKGDTLNAFLDWWDEEKTNEQSKEMAINLPGNENAIEVKTIHKAKGLQKAIVILPLAEFDFAPRANNTVWTKPTPKDYIEWGSLPISYSSYLLNTSFDSTYYNTYFSSSIEALNILYVAFTRAIERLYVFSLIGSEKSKKSGKLIKDVLTSSMFKHNSLFDPQNEEFKLGVVEKLTIDIESKEDKKKLQPFYSTQLSEKISIDQKQSKLFLAYESEKSEKIKEGLALHLAMAYIENEATVTEVLKHMEKTGIIDTVMTKKVALKIAALFQKIPQFKDWFSGKYEVLNERSIFANGNTFIPDRVMISDKKVIVVDYKREQKDSKHQKQVKNYGALLQQLGYHSIELYLVYTDEPTIVEVK